MSKEVWPGNQNMMAHNSSNQFVSSLQSLTMKTDSTSSREDMDNLSNLPENGVNTKKKSPSAATELSPSVSDQVATGTKNILESPYISDGPGRIANAPVPSVYRDDRGSIHRLRVGGKRINLLFSKEAVMRSGYLHPEPKHDMVISGKVEVWILTPQGTEKKVYGPLQMFDIPPYVPHILHFLEDSVLAEWWEQPGDFRCWFYHPYRRIVDIQNSLVSTSMGQHQLLVPQDDCNERMSSEPNLDAGARTFLWWSTGVVMGVAIGTLFANQKRR